MRSLMPVVSLLLLQLGLGTACAGAAAELSPEQPAGPVEVSLSTTSDVSRFTLGDYRYKVELRKITDSRCPPNAKCIWQGELAAEFQASREGKGKGESKRFTLGQETMPSLALLGATFELTQITETTVQLRVDLEPAKR